LSPVFRHGSLRLYLLRLLDEEPRHGYEVIRLLRDRFMGVYSPSPGTIYPRLARLEEEGLVTHDEVDGRKVYRITEAGREELRSRSDELDELEEELSASVSDIVREVREDVRQTVRSLREELTWAARESRRMGRDRSAEAREQTKQARDEAREQARQARDEAYEQARQARDEAYEQARQAREEARQAREEAGEQARQVREEAGEQVRQALDEAREQARQAREEARGRPGREDPWEQATDEGEAGQPEPAGAAGPGRSDQPGPAGAAGPGRAGTPGEDAARRVREHARWLREEAERVREGSSESAGARGSRDRLREEAGARFTGGEQDWDIPPGWAGHPGWTDWPGRRGWEDWARMRGRRGWTGALDFGTLKDLERVAVQFTSDLRKLALQSTAAGENVIADLRTILEEALERVKTEIFGSGAEGPGEPGSASSDAPAAPGTDTKDSPA
jgi:DNA-binding PadR family transcriptional regulator